MNKIKLFIASMLGAIALVFACVLGTKVNAATDYSSNGKYVVTNNNKTASWDFTANPPSENVYIKNGDSILGIVNTSSNQVTYKAGDSPKNLCLPKTSSSVNANIHIPVPSANSAGSVSFTAGSSNSARTMYLMHGDTQTETVIAYAKSASINFTSSDLTKYGDNYYLRFDSIQSSGDIKWTSISVTLTSSDEYAATATLYNVNIYDKTTCLKTYEVESGKTFDASTFKMWGYDLEFYTNSDFSTAYTTSTITSNTDLYIKKTADSTDYGYNLTNSMISEIYGVYNSSSEIEISDYYTKGSGVVANPTYFQLKNSAAQSLVITVPAGGAFVRVSCSTGGSDDRSIKLFKSEYGKNEVTDFTTSLPASDYTPINIFVTLEEGTYYLSGTNNVRVYSITMAKNVEDVVALSFDAQYDADGTAATKLRFIGTIEGLSVSADEYSKIESITFTFDFNGEDDRPLSVTQLYYSITGYDKYKAADNKMYFVYQLDNINKTGYASKKLTDCKLTVVFSNGSSQTTTHADITLPAFA